MIHSQLDLAIDIATGMATKLQVPDPIKTFPQPVFENAVQLLVITDPPARKKPATPALYRCDVTTGECKLLEKDATSFTLHRL